MVHAWFSILHVFYVKCMCGENIIVLGVTIVGCWECSFCAAVSVHIIYLFYILLISVNSNPVDHEGDVEEASKSTSEHVDDSSQEDSLGHFGEEEDEDDRDDQEEDDDDESSSDEDDESSDDKDDESSDDNDDESSDEDDDDNGDDASSQKDKDGQNDGGD